MNSVQYKSVNVDHDASAEASPVSWRQRSNIGKALLIVLSLVVVTLVLIGAQQPERGSSGVSPTRIMLKRVEQKKENVVVVQDALSVKGPFKDTQAAPAPITLLNDAPPAGQFITGIRVSGGTHWLTKLEGWWNYADPLTANADFVYGQELPDWYVTYGCTSPAFINKVEIKMADCPVGGFCRDQLVQFKAFCSEGAGSDGTPIAGSNADRLGTVMASKPFTADFSGPLVSISGKKTANLYSVYPALCNLEFHYMNEDPNSSPPAVSFPKTFDDFRNLLKTSDGGCALGGFSIGINPNASSELFTDATCTQSATQIEIRGRRLTLEQKLTLTPTGAEIDDSGLYQAGWSNRWKLYMPQDEVSVPAYPTKRYTVAILNPTIGSNPTWKPVPSMEYLSFMLNSGFCPKSRVTITRTSGGQSVYAWPWASCDVSTRHFSVAGVIPGGIGAVGITLSYYFTAPYPKHVTSAFSCAVITMDNPVKWHPQYSIYFPFNEGGVAPPSLEWASEFKCTASSFELMF